MKVRQKIGVIPYYSNDLSETKLKLKQHGYPKQYYFAYFAYCNEHNQLCMIT